MNAQAALFAIKVGFTLPLIVPLLIRLGLASLRPVRFLAAQMQGPLPAWLIGCWDDRRAQRSPMFPKVQWRASPCGPAVLHYAGCRRAEPVSLQATGLGPALPCRRAEGGMPAYKPRFRKKAYVAVVTHDGHAKQAGCCIRQAVSESPGQYARWPK